MADETFSIGRGRPIGELFRLALPTIAQMASYTLMQFIDTVILSHWRGAGVGESQAVAAAKAGLDAATAAANSGMLIFSAISLGMGIMVLVNTLSSQSFGRGQSRECGRYMWQGVWLGLAYGLALLPLRGLCGPMFRAFGHPPVLADMEAEYGRIVLWAAAIKLMATAVGQFLLSIDRPNFVLASAVAGVSVNALAAWAMVLGHLGLKPMGVAGAAWAQNIGVCCELAVLLVSCLGLPANFGFGDIAIRPAHMASLLKVGVPSGLNWFSDVLAWGFFCNGVLGELGPDAMAANTFMFRYMIVSFMPAIGLQTAVSALVGRYIGASRPDIAQKRAHLAFFVTLIYVLCCSCVFVALRGPMMRLFTSDAKVIRIGSDYLVFAAIYDLFDALYIIYTGALRGAGDTLVPTLVMSVLCWGISIGGGYLIIAAAPGLSFRGPWIMGCVYGAAVGVFMLLRFLGGKWRNIRLGPQPAGSNVPLPSATLTAP